MKSLFKKIGKGAFSKVYLAQYKSTCVEYALKIIECENIIMIVRYSKILKFKCK